MPCHLPYLARTTRDHGYTLVELLVVISIIGVLATMAIVSVSFAREKAKEAKALAEADTIVKAIYLLSADTGKWPNGCPIETVTNPEANINLASAGLTTVPTVQDFGNGCFWSASDIAKWNGPYVQTVIDPWGHPYWFDPDYYPRQGCGVSGVTIQVAVLSYGRNGRGMNEYDCDDVYKLLD